MRNQLLPLKLPVDFGKLLERKDLPACSLGESIAQNISLLLSTKIGENRFDPSFGSELWDYDFELIFSFNQWQSLISKSIVISIKKHEPRLYDIRVSVEVTEEEFTDKLKNTYRIKRRLMVDIKGTLTETREPYFCKPVLYLSPISLD